MGKPFCPRLSVGQFNPNFLQIYFLILSSDRNHSFAHPDHLSKAVTRRGCQGYSVLKTHLYHLFTPPKLNSCQATISHDQVSSSSPGRPMPSLPGPQMPTESREPCRVRLSVSNWHLWVLTTPELERREFGLEDVSPDPQRILLKTHAKERTVGPQDVRDRGNEYC